MKGREKFSAVVLVALPRRGKPRSTRSEKLLSFSPFWSVLVRFDQMGSDLNGGKPPTWQNHGDRTTQELPAGRARAESWGGSNHEWTRTHTNGPDQSNDEARIPNSERSSKRKFAVAIVSSDPPASGFGFVSDFVIRNSDFVSHAVVRIRTLRRGLQSVRRQIYLAPATFSRSVDQMPRLQETGSESVFHV